MNKIHYDISGIQNSEIKTQLKNALDKVDGISMVNIDAARGSIEVGYNQRTKILLNLVLKMLVAL